MDIQIKKERLLQALREKELDELFEITEAENGDILFQTHHNLKNGICLMTVIINPRDFTPVYFHLADLEELTEEKEIQILKLLNEFNNDDILLRFTLDHDSIFADFSYLYSSENFDAEDLIEWTIAAYRDIKENCYSKIMKLVWS